MIVTITEIKANKNDLEKFRSKMDIFFNNIHAKGNHGMRHKTLLFEQQENKNDRKNCENRYILCKNWQIMSLFIIHISPDSQVCSYFPALE